MKALSIAQPWAWAVMAGHKPYENRTRRTTYRGRLAIHTGRTDRYLDQALPCLHLMGLDPPAELPRGVLLGTVELVDVLDYDPARHARNPWACGPLLWVLRNPLPLADPIPWAGRQFLFDVPDDLLAAPQKNPGGNAPHPGRQPFHLLRRKQCLTES